MHIKSSDDAFPALAANHTNTPARSGNRPCFRRSALLGSIAGLAMLSHPARADELLNNVSGTSQSQATDNQTCQSNYQPGIVFNVTCTANDGTQPGQVGSGNGATGGSGIAATVDPLTISSDYSGAAGLSTIDLSALGGTGGKGGQAANTNNSTAATGGTGGAGGAGGDGAKLVVDGESGTIQTPSAANLPIRLQSQGGVGGMGGDPGHAKNSNTLDGNGGAGGTGGNGGDVRFTLDGADASVISQQSGVTAIDITSQGGLGGTGAAAMLWNTHINGGQGGRGGAGGEIDIDLAASTITSAGTALSVRSIAGDGNVGGGAEASRNVFVSLNGGTGGNGGAGGIVTVTSSARIATQGDNAIGIEAVSIGGNGGTGGLANTTNYENHEITTGNGGNATSAGAVTVNEYGQGRDHH